MPSLQATPSQSPEKGLIVALAGAVLVSFFPATGLADSKRTALPATGALADESSCDRSEDPASEHVHGPRPPRTVLCDPSAWPLLVDGALCEAARLLAVQLAEERSNEEGSEESASLASRLVTKALYDSGVVDAHVSAHKIRASAYNEIFDRMEAIIAARAAEVSHMGAALAPAPDGNPSAVLLLARRIVHVEPFPSRVEPGETVSVQGRVSSGVTSPQAWLGLEDGPVGRLELRGNSEEFELTAGPLPKGRHILEILVEAGEGPEVGLLAPVWVGTRPEANVTSAAPLGESDPVASLHQAVADHRMRRGLEPAVRDPRLDQVAGERADAIASRGRPVHRPGPDQDAASRLAGRGYPFAWAAENLATGPGAMDAFHGLLESPAHRRLLEKPRARRIGVGLTKDDGRVWVSILLAEPMETGPAVPSKSAGLLVESRMLLRAEDAVSTARRERGLRAAVRDPDLDEIARALSKSLASRDLPSDPSAQAEARSKALEAVRRADSVSVEIVIGGRPEDVTRAPALVEDPCNRLGLGITRARSERFGGERFWITALCVRKSGR